MEAREFGRAVRRWRDRVRPESVGIPLGGRRRAAGLRREELAALAGISVDYLARLEQGRATAPSVQVVEALARALRLSDAEREELFPLAGLATPGRGVVSVRIAPSVQRLLDRLAHTPVAVYDAMWDLIVANAPYDALMGAIPAVGDPARNAVWRNLVGPGSRAVQSADERAAVEARLVADLRRTANRHPADPRVSRLITRLRAASPRFPELWEAADVGGVTDWSRHKTIAHPALGPIALDCDILTIAGEELRIMVYTAEPGSEDADKLDLAIVLGSQELVERR